MPDDSSTTRESADICGFDLSSADVPALDPTHPILAAQRWLDDLLGLEPGHTPPASVMMCGIDTPMADAIDAVSAIITRIAAAAPDLGIAVAHSIGAGHRIAGSLPYTPLHGASAIARMSEIDAKTTQFGVAATAALDVLLSQSLIRAAQALERYEDLIADAPSGSLRNPEPQDRDTTPDWQVSPARSPSRLLTAIELTRKASSMSTAQQLTFRTMSSIPRYPRESYHLAAQPETATWPDPPLALGSIAARYIPQRIWPSVADALPRHATKDTGAFEWAMAMAFARIGTFARWSTLALQLDLPERAAHSIQSVFRRLNERGLLDETLFVLDGVAEALHSAPPPIDYARRRWIFRDLDTVSRGFRTACRAKGLVATDRRRRFAAMYLWELLTGGDVRARPGSLAPGSSGDRSAFAQFKLREGVLLVEFLREDAERHLLRHRIDEPVSWQPHFDPDSGAWRSPPPDLVRSLPGWNSPSRAGTFRAGARDHTARSRSLLDSPLITTQDLCRALQPFSHTRNAALPDVLRLRSGPDERLVLRNIRRHSDGRWDQCHQIAAVLALRKYADGQDLVLEISDGEWAVTSAGFHLLEQLEWSCPSQLHDIADDAWECIDDADMAATPTHAPTHKESDEGKAS